MYIKRCCRAGGNAERRTEREREKSGENVRHAHNPMGGACVPAHTIEKQAQKGNDFVVRCGRPVPNEARDRIIREQWESNSIYQTAENRRYRRRASARQTSIENLAISRHENSLCIYRSCTRDTRHQLVGVTAVTENSRRTYTARFSLGGTNEDRR